MSSTLSARSVARLRGRSSGRLSRPSRCRPLDATKPNLVARTTSLAASARSRARRSSSFVHGPYTSAVSRKRAAALGRLVQGGDRFGFVARTPYAQLMPMQPSPSAETTRPWVPRRALFHGAPLAQPRASDDAARRGTSEGHLSQTPRRCGGLAQLRWSPETDTSPVMRIRFSAVPSCRRPVPERRRGRSSPLPRTTPCPPPAPPGWRGRRARWRGEVGVRAERKRIRVPASDLL